MYHGPTEIDKGVYDKIDLSVYETIGKHKYDDMNTEFIVNRVLANKQAYEERQKERVGQRLKRNCNNPNSHNNEKIYR